MLRLLARLLLVLAVATPAWAAPPKPLSPQPDPPGKPPTVTLPKGTTVERLGPVLLRFKLPTGSVLDLKGCRRNQNRQLVADEGHFVAVVGKPGWTAKGAKLVDGPRPAGEPSPRDYVKIDDDVTWLPAAVQFAGIANPDPPPKP